MDVLFHQPIGRLTETSGMDFSPACIRHKDAPASVRTHECAHRWNKPATSSSAQRGEKAHGCAFSPAYWQADRNFRDGFFASLHPAQGCAGIGTHTRVRAPMEQAGDVVVGAAR
jgi:hypothetical protein